MGGLRGPGGREGRGEGREGKGKEGREGKGRIKPLREIPATLAIL